MRRGGVEARSGLVEQERPGLGGECQGDADFLTHALGVGRDTAVRRFRLQADCLEEPE